MCPTPVQASPSSFGHESDAQFLCRFPHFRYARETLLNILNARDRVRRTGIVGVAALQRVLNLQTHLVAIAGPGAREPVHVR